MLGAALCGVGFACFSSPAYAHRKKTALSTIEWKAGSRALEITHTLHLHDAEQALSRLGKLEQPDLTSLRARANLALYVQERFTVSHLNGEGIPLHIIGAEIDGAYAYVYQDVTLSGVPDGLEVKNTLLQDIYLNQTNLVNITLGTELKSLTFFTGDSAKKIEA